MTETITDEEIKTAVALFYDGKNDPTVTASGTGEIAEEIIRIAQEHEIAICDNPPLVELLSRLELGDSIPESLYHAVAQIIAFAYAMELEMTPKEDAKK